MPPLYMYCLDLFYYKINKSEISYEDTIYSWDSCNLAAKKL